MQLKVSDRLAIIDRLGSELQARYTFDEIDAYLEAFAIRWPSGGRSSYHGTKLYAKAALNAASAGTLGEIIEDLGIEALATISARAHMPSVWTDTSKLRVFISHLSTEKGKATRTRDALAA